MCKCQMVIYHQIQSNQLKNCKFYENVSEYANFSTSSGKGHKDKGQIQNIPRDIKFKKNFNLQFNFIILYFFLFTLLEAVCEFKINGGKMPIGVSLQRYSSLVLGIIFQAFSCAPVN